MKKLIDTNEEGSVDLSEYSFIDGADELLEGLEEIDESSFCAGMDDNEIAVYHSVKLTAVEE